SGKIMFYASPDSPSAPDFSKVVGGKTTPGHIPMIYGHQLMYCENYFQSHIPYPKGCTLMTFTIKNPDHIELTNSTYGDTIHLMRSAAHTQSSRSHQSRANTRYGGDALKRNLIPTLRNCVSSI